MVSFLRLYRSHSLSYVTHSPAYGDCSALVLSYFSRSYSVAVPVDLSPCLGREDIYRFVGRLFVAFSRDQKKAKNQDREAVGERRSKRELPRFFLCVFRKTVSLSRFLAV
jgi:hypothetical protein